MTEAIKAADFQLDMSGEPCPYPVVAMLEAMQALQGGQVLEVLADCPQSINSIPADATRAGYRVLKVEQQGPTIRYWIER
ncbi:sulfurtransferase-like selenium metabolism protein YedF [Paraburkholderia antibiotica]|uniref:Sulfurtransferase-like selenium metabolism protein YedF n=1 Tax=Paraburkholderia antibiotica TaxID=2728839 RepID=A0A7X9ZWH7_9BURK|nr:sulfurtransferase-like selenium metabolism protein YedF [Paraburkholderia antibiotica]NML31194.1 sulfurtransferase-like selenium metabolism protein YedF [Paraburkholderia antibiotica]